MAFKKVIRHCKDCGAATGTGKRLCSKCSGRTTTHTDKYATTANTPRAPVGAGR